MRRFKKKEEICGIYYFEVISGNPCKIGWKYIGQSKDILDREYGHFRDLSKKEHSNRRLQYYFNKYGKNSLKFGILQKCPNNELDFWERFWIKCLDCQNTGFNVLDGGNNPPIRYKKCYFTNMVTGESESCDSLKEFAEKHKLIKVSVSELSRGEVNYVGEWYNPNFSWRPEYTEVISPDNKKHIVVKSKFKKFCQLNRIKNHNAFNEMINENRLNSQGWRLFKNKDAEYLLHTKKFELLSPDGKLFTGENINKFCRENNLDPGYISQVTLGKINHYKNWKRYNASLTLSK